MEQLGEPEITEEIDEQVGHLPPLSERQQRVLGCFACFSGENKEIVVNAITDLMDCNKLTNIQCRNTQSELVVKKRLKSVKIENPPVKLRGHQVGYQLTEAGWKDVENRPPKTCHQSQKYKSANPYINATRAEAKVLDCIRCLNAQGEEATVHRLSACDTASMSSDVARNMAEKLEMRGFIQGYTISVLSSTINNLKRRVFRPTEKGKPFLEPSLLEGCETLAQERVEMVKKATPATANFLGCLACQQASIKQGSRPAIVETPGCANQRSSANTLLFKRTFGSFEEMGLLRRDNPSESSIPKQYTLSDAGKKLIDTYSDIFPVPEHCKPKPKPKSNIIKIEQSQQRLEDKVASCIGCIIGQQRDSGVQQECNATMLRKCLGLHTETLDKITGRLIDKGRITETAPGIFVSHDAQALSKYVCGYRVDAPTKLQEISTAIYAAIHNDKKPDLPKVLSAVEEVRLAQTIQTSEDPNERNAAITEFFMRNLRLVFHMAETYRPPIPNWPIEKSDVLQVGFITLENCVRRFSPSYGLKFSAYFTRAYRNNLDTELGRLHGVGSNNVLIVRHVSTYIARLVVKTGAAKNLEAQDIIAFIEAQPDHKKLKTSPERAVQIYRRYAFDAKNVSIQKVLSEDFTVEDTLSTQDSDNSLSLSIRQYFNSSRFDEIDRAIVEALLINDVKPNSLAATFGIDVVEIRQRRERLTVALSHPTFGMLSTVSEAFDWQEKARCKDDRLFAEAITEGLAGRNIRSFTKVCDLCPVKKSCRDLYNNLSPKPQKGVWGGQTYRSVRDSTKKIKPPRE